MSETDETGTPPATPAQPVQPGQSAASGKSQLERAEGARPPAQDVRPVGSSPAEGLQGAGSLANHAAPAEGTKPSSAADASKRPEIKRKRGFWFELPILLIVAVLVAVGVRTFLVQTFYIPSKSMENTLLENDRVLVNKVVYDIRDPKRGEVIVFQPPASWNAGPNKDDFIKRIIGVGGDHVVCCDSKQRITINGEPLEEDYLYPGDQPSTVEFDITVPKGRLWMMGDHRSASADSRAHVRADSYHGTVPLDSVVGRAFAIFWPVNRAAWLSVPDGFSDIPSRERR